MLFQPYQICHHTLFHAQLRYVGIHHPLRCPYQHSFHHMQAHGNPSELLHYLLYMGPLVVKLRNLTLFLCSGHISSHHHPGGFPMGKGLPGEKGESLSQERLCNANQAPASCYLLKPERGPQAQPLRSAHIWALPTTPQHRGTIGLKPGAPRARASRLFPRPTWSSPRPRLPRDSRWGPHYLLPPSQGRHEAESRQSAAAA